MDEVADAADEDQRWKVTRVFNHAVKKEQGKRVVFVQA